MNQNHNSTHKHVRHAVIKQLLIIVAFLLVASGCATDSERDYTIPTDTSTTLNVGTVSPTTTEVSRVDDTTSTTETNISAPETTDSNEPEPEPIVDVADTATETKDATTSTTGHTNNVPVSTTTTPVVVDSSTQTEPAQTTTKPTNTQTTNPPTTTTQPPSTTEPTVTTTTKSPQNRDVDHEHVSAHTGSSKEGTRTTYGNFKIKLSDTLPKNPGDPPHQPLWWGPGKTGPAWHITPQFQQAADWCYAPLYSPVESMSSRYVLQAADWCAKVLHSFIVATRPVVAVDPECFVATFQHRVVRGLAPFGMQPRGTWPPVPTKALPPHVDADALPEWTDCPSRLWPGQYLPQRSTDAGKRACLWAERVLQNKDPEAHWAHVVKEGLVERAKDRCIKEQWPADYTRCEFAHHIWWGFSGSEEDIEPNTVFRTGDAC